MELKLLGIKNLLMGRCDPRINPPNILSSINFVQT